MCTKNLVFFLYTYQFFLFFFLIRNEFSFIVVVVVVDLVYLVKYITHNIQFWIHIKFGKT